MSSDTLDNAELSSLSEQDRNNYLSDKIKKFKLTITVCIIYGLIAFILLCIALGTSWGKRILYNELMTFIITFIIGTTIIIFWLANIIYNFKPPKKSDKLPYDAELCPDFWKLQNIENPNKIDSQNRSYLSPSLNQNLFRYKCMADNKLFQPNKFIENDNLKAPVDRKNYKLTKNNSLYVSLLDKEKSGINDTNTFNKFKEYSANMNGYSYINGRIVQNSSDSLIGTNNETFNINNVPLSCDTVYPLYLSVMDKKNSDEDPSEPSNRFRCAYAKSCGIPWTEAGCI